MTSIRKSARATTSASPRAAASFHRTRISRMPDSAGCSGWCTRSVRFRKRWRCSGTTTSPPPTASSPARSDAVQGDEDDGAQAGRSPRSARADRAVPSVRARQLPQPARRSCARSGDARVARRAPERAQPAAGELCPRNHGALHVGRRQLHGTGCVRRRASVHRLEPAQCHGPVAMRIRARITSSSTTRGQHDPTAKTFTFPIYSDGNRTIPARSAADGMQDGIDFITALAQHPQTARRLARKLWNFFVSELEPPDPAFVESVASEYLRSGTEMKPVVRYILQSEWFSNPDRWFARYSWPVEFVVRADPRDRLGGFLGRYRANAADEHGSDAVRAAGCERMGARARMVFDRRDARPDELRRDAWR